MSDDIYLFQSNSENKSPLIDTSLPTLYSECPLLSKKLCNCLDVDEHSKLCYGSYSQIPKLITDIL